MQPLLNFLKGKKTYFIALGMIVYAVLGLVFKYHSSDVAMQIIFNALGLMGLRLGVTQEVQKLK